MKKSKTNGMFLKFYSVSEKGIKIIQKKKKIVSVFTVFDLILNFCRNDFNRRIDDPHCIPARPSLARTHNWSLAAVRT